jgi:Ca2+-binding EF-hand superfamily protein
MFGDRRRSMAIDMKYRTVRKAREANARCLKQLREMKARLIDQLHKSGSARKVFDALDTDKSGTIDIGELRAALSKMGLQLVANDIRACMDAIDVNGDGQISFAELSNFLFDDEEAFAETVEPGLEACCAFVEKELVKYSQVGAAKNMFRSPLFKVDGLSSTDLAKKLQTSCNASLSQSDMDQLLVKHGIAPSGRFDFEQLCDQRTVTGRRSLYNSKVDHALKAQGLSNWCTLTPAQKEVRKNIRRAGMTGMLSDTLKTSAKPAFQNPGADAAIIDADMEERLECNRATMMRRRMIQRVASASSVVALFEKLDSDQSGSLSSEEFFQGLKSSGALSEGHIRMLFREIDTNNNQEISLGELKAFLASDPHTGLKRDNPRPVADAETKKLIRKQMQIKVSQLENLRSALKAKALAESMTFTQVFEHYDSDHNGWMSQEELKDMLEDLGIRNTPGELYAIYNVLGGTKQQKRITPDRLEDFIKNFDQKEHMHLGSAARNNIGNVAAIVKRRQSRSDGVTRGMTVDFGASAASYSAFVRRVLQTIDAYMTVTGMKVLDLYRNLGAQAAGKAQEDKPGRSAWAEKENCALDDDELTKSQFTQMLHIMGTGNLIVDLDDPDKLNDLYSTLDLDGNNQIGVRELDSCLRAWRRTEAIHKSKTTAQQAPLMNSLNSLPRASKVLSVPRRFDTKMRRSESKAATPEQDDEESQNSSHAPALSTPRLATPHPFVERIASARPDLTLRSAQSARDLHSRQDRKLLLTQKLSMRPQSSASSSRALPRLSADSAASGALSSRLSQMSNHLSGLNPELSARLQEFAQF